MGKNRKRQDTVGVTGKRVRILSCAFFLILAYLAWAILDMQVFSYEKYQEKVLNQVTTTSSLRAERGKIYDSRGNLLATSKSEWRIFLSPVDIRDSSKKENKNYAEEIAKDLSELLSLSYDDLYRKAANSKVLD